jgi:Holliday junction DNA helicase RuvB
MPPRKSSKKQTESDADADTPAGGETPVRSAAALPDDDAVEISLRPQRFQDFVGQERVKENLCVYVKAALMRKTALDHVLLSGPPGLGKTTLARIIAEEMGVSFQGSTAPALKRPGDLVGLLTSLPEGTVLFIDEIHRLPAAFEEYLYSAMEDFFIDVPVDQGPSARSVRFNLKPFTLIGATTRDGLLSRPFQDRFGIPQKLSFYTPEELTRIVTRSASILNCAIEPDASREIAGRARKTPRIANRLLRRLRDWADVEGDGTVTQKIVKKGLDREGVDEAGLDGMDRKVLQAIASHHGTPVGVKTIAIIVGEEEDTIEDVYEPFLIQEGFILKTPRGRLLSAKGYEHIGLKAPRVQTDSGLF